MKSVSPSQRPNRLPICRLYLPIFLQIEVQIDICQFCPYLSICRQGLYLPIEPLSADIASIGRQFLCLHGLGQLQQLAGQVQACLQRSVHVPGATPCGLGRLQQQATFSSIGRYEAYLQILKSIGRYCSLSADIVVNRQIICNCR